MNAKHLASLLLFIVVLLLFQLTIMLNKRWTTAMEATRDAEDRHGAARKEQTDTSNALEKVRRETAARRKYLEMWRQKFEQSGTEISAKNEFTRMLKRFPTLVQFVTNTSGAVENKDMGFVNRRITSSVKLEGDAEKTIQLLASIERELSTSRISMLEIRKGQRGNDVELDLAVEFPLLAVAEPEKK
ncbi:MAG TPA: hypothetical protein VG796_25505 [Verrucomicrobiales bacterium]|jgi:hypothetical protein|nr:hypothetical protein [Verrucomicrobiales bacterium]